MLCLVVREGGKVGEGKQDSGEMRGTWSVMKEQKEEVKMAGGDEPNKSDRVTTEGLGTRRVCWAEITDSRSSPSKHPIG